MTLLWLSLLLGIPATIYENQQTPPNASGAAAITGLVVLLYAVGAGLNIFAARGHNWARITLLVFSCLAVALYLSMIQDYLERPVPYLALDLVTLVMVGSRCICCSRNPARCGFAVWSEAWQTREHR